MKAKLLRITFLWFFPLSFFPNIILLNICVLWLKSEVFSLTEYKRKAKEREKHWCQFVCPDSDFWVENFFFSQRRIWWECFSLQGELPDIHPETSHKAILSSKTVQGGKKLNLWVKFSSNLQRISTCFRWAIKALFTISDCKTLKKKKLFLITWEP